MAVKFIKFKHGEEIVATLEEDTLANPKVELKNMVKFVVTHEGVGMLPAYPLCKEDKITVDTNLISFTSDVDQEVYNHYQAQFGGVILPSAADTFKIVQ